MKKAPLRLLAALVLGLGTISAASAKSLFDNFYFFGDSLTDMGNFQGSPHEQQKAPMTSGDSTWANYFANQFGGNASPSSAGGNDYAYAGAQTGPSIIDGTISDPGVIGQVQKYLSTHPADSRALYSIWAGANNVNVQLNTAVLTYAFNYFVQNGVAPTFTQVQDYLSGIVPGILNQTVTDINTMVNALHQAGAKYIMVFNLPDLGQTPLGKSSGYGGGSFSTDLTNISQAFNQSLSSSLNAEGFDVIQIDIYSLFGDVMADPAHFGFTNITGSCATKDANGNITSTCSNPNDYLFWDDQHPTDAAHQMIADYALSIVEGPTRAAILAEAPFGVMDSQNMNIEGQLYNVRTGITKLAVGQNSTFASVNYAPYSQDSQGTVSPGFDANATNITAGIVRRINNNLIAGAGIAHSFGHVDFGHNTGGFDMNENMATLFGGYQYKGFYSDAMATYGVVDYSRVARKIKIGPSQNSASGNTEGSQFGGNLIAGYNIINRSNFQTGPLVNIDYQHIRVNAYSETGSINGIAEQFDNQTNESLTTSAGWQLAYTFDVNNTPIMPFAQFSYNHQWLDKDRDVGAGLTSLPGSHFTIPFSATHNANYGLASAGVSFGLTKSVSLSLGYQTTLFYSDGRSQNANASIQALL